MGATCSCVGLLNVEAGRAVWELLQQVGGASLEFVPFDHIGVRRVARVSYSFLLWLNLRFGSIPCSQFSPK